MTVKELAALLEAREDTMWTYLYRMERYKEVRCKGRRRAKGGNLWEVV